MPQIHKNDEETTDNSPFLPSPVEISVMEHSALHTFVRFPRFLQWVSTAELINQWEQLPFDPTSGPNTALSMLIWRWKYGELHWVERWQLRRVLKGRLRAFRSMKDELHKQRVKIQGRQKFFSGEDYFWKLSANRFIVNERYTQWCQQWCQARDMFISCMMQHQLANPSN